jgi:hypothetical protein
MDLTFRRALVSTATGLGVGAGYVIHLLRSGTCADLLAVAGSRTACTTQEVMSAGLALFTLVTLTLTLLVAVVALHNGLRDRVGDTFLATGSIVLMVQATVLTVTGAPLGIALALVVAGVTLVALRRAASPSRQDREVATVLAMLLTMSAVTWVAVQPAALLLGLPVTVLWVLGALACLDGARAVDEEPWRRHLPARSPVDG